MRQFIAGEKTVYRRAKTVHRGTKPTYRVMNAIYRGGESTCRRLNRLFRNAIELFQPRFSLHR